MGIRHGDRFIELFDKQERKIHANRSTITLYCEANEVDVWKTEFLRAGVYPEVARCHTDQVILDLEIECPGSVENPHEARQI